MYFIILLLFLQWAGKSYLQGVTTSTGNSYLQEVTTSYVNETLEMVNTFDAIDDVLASPKVTSYLMSLPSEMHRILVRNQLRYCPYVPLCNISLDISPPQNYMTCCVWCSCDDECHEKKTCCPDIIPVETLEELTKDVTRTGGRVGCFAPKLVRNASVQIAGIPYCPYDTNSELSRKCSGAYITFETLAMEDVIPVFDVMRNISYRNKWCAYCNGVNHADLQFFNVRLKCASFLEGIFENEKSEILSAILHRSIPCDIEFSSSISEFCNSLIGECNVTGAWNEYNLADNVGCFLYESDIHVNDTNLRNVHCAKCNGLEPAGPSCAHWSYSIIYDTDVYLFSQLLNFDRPSEVFEIQSKDDCRIDTELYDNQTGSCIPFTCSPMRNPSHGQCIPNGKIGKDIGIYKVTVSVRPHNNMTVEGAFQILYDGLQVEIESYAFPEELFPYISICERNLTIFSKDEPLDRTEKLDNLKSVQVSKFDFTIIVFVEFSHHPEKLFEQVLMFERNQFSFLNQTFHWQYTDSYLLMTDETLNVNLTSELDLKITPMFESFVIAREKVNEQSRLVVQFMIDNDPAACPPEPLIHVWKLQSCPLIEVPMLKLDRMVTNGVVHLTNDKMVVLPLHLIGCIEDQIQSILVCAETYFKYGLNGESDADGGSRDLTAESIVTLICISLSMLGCLLTLAVYSYLHSLRTIPGKNIMALTSALLLAQASYIVSSFGRFERKSIVCQTLGLLTHWLWLLTFSWMNTCTFHTFRVLTKTRPMRLGSGWKRIMAYHVYCVLVSSFFVSVNICWSVFGGSADTIGYGKVICYIDSPLLSGLTFALPLGIIILANFGMFIRVVIKIRHAAEVHKNVKHERNDLSVMVKLSTLTGLTWTLGYIGTVSGLRAFGIVFTILNASQGAFIFLSFAANRRVYNLIRKRITGEESSVTSSARTGTTKL